MASPKLATWSYHRVSSLNSTTLSLLEGPPAGGAIVRYVAGRVAAGRGGTLIGPLLLAAHAVLEDYPAIGLADAMNAVLARECRTDVIATLDHRHFRFIRPLTHTALSGCFQPTCRRNWRSIAQVPFVLPRPTIQTGFLRKVYLRRIRTYQVKMVCGVSLIPVILA